MSGFGFTPLFGNWIITGLICVIFLAFCASAVLFYRRHRETNDATTLDWVRRSLIAILLCVAALGPSTVSASSTEIVNGIDVFFAVDVTGSMAVRDATYGSNEKIERLQAAQRAITDIVDLYPAASFAAVSFASTAKLEVPLTSDTTAIANWNSALTVESTSVSAGSTLDAPLDTLLEALRAAHGAHPNNALAVYYISDGEQTSEAQRRTFSSLRSFITGGAVVGVGSTSGGRVPLVKPTMADRNSDFQWIKDPNTDKPAISRIDMKSLQNIAKELSVPAIFFNATTTASTLKIQQSGSYISMESIKKRPRRNLLVWPLSVVIMGLLVWEFAVNLARRRRYL